MTKAESELAEALRERLKIISDEESRRNPEQHVKRLREVSEHIETLVAASPSPSRLAWPTSSTAEATTKPSSSWKVGPINLAVLEGRAPASPVVARPSWLWGQRASACRS